VALVPRGVWSYDYPVEYDDFQDTVQDLADSGTRLTKGNVALRLKIDPASAGKMLDRMTRDGRLELDIDERSGEIFYEMRRRDAAAAPRASSSKSALAGLGKALDSSGALTAAKLGTALVMAKAGAGGVTVAPEKRRQIALGVILGGLLPGFGLAYTAPWPVVVASSVVVALGIKVIGLIPLFSSFLLIPFVAVCAVASAVLGGLYTWQYNQTGKRTALGDEPTSPKQVMKRLLRK
jgi:hypothetical protein